MLLQMQNQPGPNKKMLLYLNQPQKRNQRLLNQQGKRNLQLVEMVRRLRSQKNLKNQRSPVVSANQLIHPSPPLNSSNRSLQSPQSSSKKLLNLLQLSRNLLRPKRNPKSPKEMQNQSKRNLVLTKRPKMTLLIKSRKTLS